MLRCDGELLFLRLEPGQLLLQIRDLLMQATLARQGFACEIFATTGERGTSLTVELGLLLCQVLDLDLQTLATGGDVGHTAPHLLQKFQLLLIGVVQRLTRILRSIECRIRLGFEDKAEALPQAHGCLASRCATRAGRLAQPTGNSARRVGPEPPTRLANHVRLVRPQG